MGDSVLNLSARRDLGVTPCDPWPDSPFKLGDQVTVANDRQKPRWLKVIVVGFGIREGRRMLLVSTDASNSREAQWSPEECWILERS